MEASTLHISPPSPPRQAGNSLLLATPSAESQTHHYSTSLSPDATADTTADANTDVNPHADVTPATTPDTTPDTHPSHPDPPLSSSPNSSLAPPEALPARTLSRQVSQSWQADDHMFQTQASTHAVPETPAPRSFHNFTCHRTGSLISTSSTWIEQRVPLGVRIFAHLPTNPDPAIAAKTKNPALITAILTAGPTLMVNEKPCMLTAAPLSEKAWRESAQAITYQYDKQSRNMKDAVQMQSRSGRTLGPLRQYGSRSRANSIASAFRTALPLATIGIPTTSTVESTKVGRTWLCSMGCEGATGRKRDWALIELDPNQVDAEQRYNVVVIDGKEKRLVEPAEGEVAKPGTRVVLATAGSRNIPLEGTVGEVEESVYGYHTIQKIVLDREGILQAGDAGASVVNPDTGVYYGMLIMVGMLKKEIEAKKKAGEEAHLQSVAWFVPYSVMAKDMVQTYPLGKISFGGYDEKSAADRREERAKRREEKARRKAEKAAAKAAELAAGAESEGVPAVRLPDAAST